MLRCLAAVLAQDHPSFEVLVLDNGSQDGTPDAVRAAAAAARVDVRVEIVPGTLGRVRNAARDHAGGTFIAFTDSDCLPARDWLTQATRTLAADPGLGCVCGVTVPESIPVRPWAHTVRVDRFTWRFESCNVVFRAEAFGAGFDEDVGDGWEDTAAGFGLLARGWRAGFAERALVRHDVTYPGFWHHVRREQRQRNAGHVVRRFPEVRRRVLFAGLFVNARGAASFAAYAGLTLGVRWPRARWLAAGYVPYLARRVLPWRMAQIVILDGAMHYAMLRGGITSRVPLL